eukprot:7315234-Lingulodinium_polyedra.AAC.1
MLVLLCESWARRRKWVLSDHWGVAAWIRRPDGLWCEKRSVITVTGWSPPTKEAAFHVRRE